MSTKTLLLLCVISLVGACRSAQGMREVRSPVYAPSGGMATVVFARHTHFGGAINFVVVDHNQRFIAGLKGQAHAIAMVPPGEYRFYVIAENTEVIHATLQPGRMYVVEARVRTGFWKARVTAEAVRRNTERFAEALSWIKETPALVPDGSRGQDWADSHRDNIRARSADIEAAWLEQDGNWQAQHTLAAEDGYLTEELRGAL
jgi:hypothetical protein